MVWKTGNVPWNKGLTVATDERVKECGQKISKSRRKLDKESFCPICGDLLETSRSLGGHMAGHKNKGRRRGDLKGINNRHYGKPFGKNAPDYTGSLKCLEETKEKISKGNTGKVRSEEVKEQISTTQIKRYKEHPEIHPNYILSRNKGRMTKIEKLTNEFFERLGFKMGEDFVYQYLVVCSRGTKWIDFYFPKLKLGVECDGAYWHQDKEKDRKRDEEILSFLGEGSIIEHLTEKEIFSLRYLQGVKHV